ncbi:MAG: radical SAM protein [Gallionellaceae bacterium]|nr:radical SAM protein [Gallionellaceae bacterium]
MDQTPEKTLKTTELTAIVGREKFDRLADVVGREAWEQYRSSYEAAANLEVVTNYPLQIDFELNASCNLKCPMCPISAESPKGKGKKTWFPFDLYKEIITDGVKRGLCVVKLNYVNEPLIRKDLPEFVKLARDIGVLDVYFSTNGLLLDDTASRLLIQAGLTRIQVSLDAHTTEIYDQVRPGGDLEKTRENVEHMMALRHEMDSITPLVRVNFVRTELNEHELEPFVAHWQDRADMIGIQEYVKPPKASGNLVSHTTEYKRLRGFRCSFPFKQLVVTNERKILPCCTFWGEHLVLGHCEDADSIITAWNSEKMKELRHIHSQGEYWRIEPCRQCVEGGVLA